MRKTAVVAVLVALLGGCSGFKQSEAQNNVTEADVTACHAFGKWDQEAHNQEQQAVQGLQHMLTDLQNASDSTIKTDARLLSDALSAQDTGTFQNEIKAIGIRCNYLGLIDAQGNPT